MSFSSFPVLLLVERHRMAGMAASWHFDNLITLYPASLHIPTSPQRRNRCESSVTRHSSSTVSGNRAGRSNYCHRDPRPLRRRSSSRSPSSFLLIIDLVLHVPYLAYITESLDLRGARFRHALTRRPSSLPPSIDCPADAGRAQFITLPPSGGPASRAAERRHT